jgi:hypothetical protein
MLHLKGKGKEKSKYLLTQMSWKDGGIINKLGNPDGNVWLVFRSTNSQSGRSEWKLYQQGKSKKTNSTL